ncbi:Z1 domain-containing protein [Rhodocyclus gracilis]|uniref:Putative endonuclease Z1 domain-containing protein n=1 Tax=Rhodocyclus tenuis TaxID=1066 RepID=A0A6L5JZA3_RHOTE|nr:Z1 domain-containing protein [Rhodocyclus gracilis]MQY52685.1 hypothetical protein [Rhodocyclus gracilis]
MATTIQILNTVKPPLRWVPEPKDFTNDFLTSKSQDPNGPSIEDLRDGPDSVLQEAIRILGRCLPPTEHSGSETGLVVGYVQSGKTMSFETVIALARDNEYGIVIVLAGTKNNLRDQSEDRLKKDLGTDEGDHWYHLSNPTKAQRSQIENKVAAFRKKSSRKSLLITVLKHGSHIETLTAVLKATKLDGVPALIIDDESDQASLNTQASRIRKKRAPANAMSTTYEKILGLRNVLPHHSYLQYTATPQANLLLAQTDLLNPSFSELVTPGDAYTGGHAFFKGPVNLVEDIPPEDVPTPQVPLKSPPKSLLRALRTFLLIAAQHSLTRKKGLTSKDRNRSMMVHPAVATTQHKIYKDWVEKAFTGLKRRVEAEHVSEPVTVAALFQTEYDSLAKTFPGVKPLPELIEAMADEVLDDLNCVEVNGTPDAEKKVNWKATKYWILVGGAKLDRGYTVEGLCVTYMPRPLGTSPAADTLQQRARFFGYKKAYLGLCRVFVQTRVKNAFTEYVEHEDFVRAALAENRGKPLREWRRDFILTQLLKPTRPNVVGLGTRRVLVEDWMVPKVLQRDEAAAEKNRLLLDAVEKQWSKDFTRVNAATIVQLAPAKGQSPNDIIEAVPLTTVLEDFLLNLEVKDPGDAEEHSAMLVALSAMLAKDPSLKVDVFLMNQLTPGYRSRVSTAALTAINKFAPINQYFSQSANSVNDRSFYTPDRISLQLRRFDLGHEQREQSKADIRGVTWYALYVPKRLKKDLVVEERG